MPADPRATLLKLLDALRDLDEKRAAIYAEMDTLLKGGEGIGQKVTRLKLSYSQAWETRYHSKYTFTNHAMVGASLKRFLAAHGETEITARMFTFIKNDDPFYVRGRHDFALFVKAFNQCVGLPAPVADTQVEASTARLREMRGQ